MGHIINLNRCHVDEEATSCDRSRRGKIRGSARSIQLGDNEAEADYQEIRQIPPLSPPVLNEFEGSLLSGHSSHKSIKEPTWRLNPLASLSQFDNIEQYSADDIEILQNLGQFTLVESSPGEGTSTSLPTAYVDNYVARFRNGLGGEQTVFLKEFPPSTRQLAISELKVYSRFLETREWFGATKTSDDPVLKLLGFFESTQGSRALDPTSAGSSDGWGYDGKRNEEEFSLWLLFEFDPILMRVAARFPSAPQRRAPWSILNPFEEVYPTQRAAFLKKVVKGAMEALLFCHERGVFHGGLSPWNLLISTYDQRASGPVKVKLVHFASAGDISKGVDDLDDINLYKCRSLGAVRPMEMMQTLRWVDMSAMALSLLHLVFASLAKDGLRERTSPSALESLWVHRHVCDVAAIRASCVEVEEWKDVVWFLDQQGGQGWVLFVRMLQFNECQADEALLSSWLSDV